MSGTHVCWAMLMLPTGFFVMNALIRLSQRALRSLSGTTPDASYQACHATLNHIVYDAYALLSKLEQVPPLRWEHYTVSHDGLLIPRFVSQDSESRALVAATSWTAISGVGLDMSPLYRWHGDRRNRYSEAVRVNIGYQMTLLVVPFTGSTITINIPLRNNDAAVWFTAHVLAYARYHERRLSLMGFDKAITRSVVHLDNF